MNNKLYEGQKLNDFRELVNLYKTKYKDLIAFEYKETPESKEHIKITYEQFAKDIEALACKLMELKAKRIALISDNRYEWCVSYLAITTAGLVVVPLDKSLPDNELLDLLKRSEADGIIFSDKYVQALKDATCKLKICMDYDEDKDGILSYSSLLSEGYTLDKSKYNDLKIDNKAMSIILFTSGTTSIAKAVMLSQYAICMDLYALSQMIDIKTTDKFLSFLPLHHTFESTTTFLFGTSCGITIAICDGLRYIQNNLVEYHITGFVCVPLMLEIMYKKILKEIESQHKTTLVKIMRVLFRHANIETKRKIFKSIIDGLGGKLRTIIAGGAPMDKETIKGYNDFGFDVHQGYGLTETAPVLAGENSFNKKTGSVGFPLPTIELKVDKPDENGIGEIIAKTPAIMLGYYKNEEATNEVLKDGWFYTGDLGYIDEDGFVFITGRKKDMIVLKNGKKIFPEEIEILINKLPYVTESMVFASLDDSKQDRNTDNVICAEIIYDEDELKKAYPNIKESEYCDTIWNDIKTKVNKQMPAYKYIRRILVSTEPIIKTTTQKIKRSEELKKIQKKNK